MRPHWLVFSNDTSIKNLSSLCLWDAGDCSASTGLSAVYKWKGLLGKERYGGGETRHVVQHRKVKIWCRSAM